jgi:hypothetical protein
MYFVIPPRNYFFKSNKIIFDFIASRPRFGAKYLESGHLHPDWADSQIIHEKPYMHQRMIRIYDINTKFSNYLATNNLEVLAEVSSRMSTGDVYTVIALIKNISELKQFIQETDYIKNMSSVYIILHPEFLLTPEVKIPENYKCIQTSTSILIHNINIEIIFSITPCEFTKKNIYISWLHPDAFLQSVRTTASSVEKDHIAYKLWFYRS